ncbi:HD domain-containing protein, partial [Frisingicoccus sp.]|uniref:HD domain-containing protein n=1 Tax=Frisingicoccus sp. TaxID=1918627 RepID=UPI0037369229
MIDLQFAREEFQKYLDQYDRNDEKIKLKIIHTEGVIDCVRKITSRMDISVEDKELAELIALLHDIGRFEQIRCFDSFEPGTMDHAAYGVGLLFGPRNMIRQFVKNTQWDSIIKTAIAKHSDFQLEGIADEQTLFHAKMIRDADKLDNCRV